MGNNLLSERRRQIDRLLLRLATAKERVREEKQEGRRAQCELQHTGDARVIVQEIAQRVQETTHARIAIVVTRCLQAVWGDRYEFRIEFEKKRGKTEARLLFVRHDGLELDPLEESSGGVVDVAAFALRLASIVMTRPCRRRLVVLDEPFKNVRGAIYQERVRQMVEQVSKDLEFQVVLNTDLEAIQTGEIVSLE